MKLRATRSHGEVGAREGVMQAVLTKARMAPGDVLVLVVVTRAWVTVLDIVPAAIVLILRRRPSGRVVALSSHPPASDGPT